MTSSNNLTFLTNDVKGLQSSKKRTKLIEYFRSKLNHNGFLFLQETHSSIKNENTWDNDFNERLSFLMEHLTHVVFYLLTLVKHPLSLTNKKLIRLEES